MFRNGPEALDVYRPQTRRSNWKLVNSRPALTEDSASNRYSIPVKSMPPSLALLFVEKGCDVPLIMAYVLALVFAKVRVLS